MRYILATLFLTLAIYILTQPTQLQAEENQANQDPDEPPSSSIFFLQKWGVESKSREFKIVWTESDSSKREREEREEKERREMAKKVLIKSKPSLSFDIKIIGESSEQCVQYFKRMSGISRSLGYAGSIPAQGNEPKVGSGALESNHISLVVAIGDGYVIVNEANFRRGYITERKIPLPSIRGFIYN